MKETELRDLLPAERPLPAARRRDMKEQLMEQMETEERVDKRRYRFVVGAVAATLVLIAGVAVMSLGGDDGSDTTGTAGEGDDTTVPETTVPPGIPRTVPIPDEVARAQERWVEYGNPGDLEYVGLPEVYCAAPAGTTSSEMSNGPNEAAQMNAQLQVPSDRTMTMADFVDACTNDAMRENWGSETTDDGVFDPQNATACVVEGQYPLAVVALFGMSCEDAAGATSYDETMRTMTDADVAMLERIRAINIAIIATDVSCATKDEAVAQLQRVIAEESLGLEVTTFADEEYTSGANGFPPVDPATLCFRGAITWANPSAVADASVFAIMPD